MILLDGTAGSLGHALGLLTLGQHKGRFVEFLPDTSGDDSCQRFMALREEYHQNLILPILFFHLPAGLRLSPGRHVLSHIVQFLQFFCQPVRFLFCAGLQKTQGQFRRLKPPSCI